MAHSSLVSDDVQIRQEVIAQAIALDSDRLWIEKVRVSSEALDVHPMSSNEDVQGALTDLTSLILLAADDPEFVDALQSDWLSLLERIPHEVLRASPELQALRRDPLAQMSERLQIATPMILDRLTQSPGSST